MLKSYVLTAQKKNSFETNLALSITLFALPNHSSYTVLENQIFKFRKNRSEQKLLIMPSLFTKVARCGFHGLIVVPCNELFW